MLLLEAIDFNLSVLKVSRELLMFGHELGPVPLSREIIIHENNLMDL
jgi:hypothetical protein